MSTGPSDNGDGDDTPPTRSYVDALLRGNLSTDQVASLRAEIASRAEEESALLARSYPAPAPSSPPSAPRSSPRSPRSYSPVPSSGSRGGSHPPSGPPPASWPSARSYGPPAEDDDQRTVARVYRPPPRSYAAPQEEQAPVSFEPPADIAEPYVFDDELDGESLTAVHIYGAGETDAREHPPTNRSGARERQPTIDLRDVDRLAGHLAPSATPTPEYEALLAETYLVALGGTVGVPCLAVHPPEVPSLPLGPQAAFVLSRLDGQSSVDDVLDMSGLARVETLRILYDLLQKGIIRVEGLDV